MSPEKQAAYKAWLEEQVSDVSRKWTEREALREALTLWLALRHDWPLPASVRAKLGEKP